MTGRPNVAKPAHLSSMVNGMAENFSWDAQTKLYEELYSRLQRLPR